MDSALISLLGVAGIAGIAFYHRVAARLPETIPARPDFGRGDAIVAGLLGAWCVFVVFRSAGKRLEVNVEVLLENAFLNFCVVAIICGFLVGRGRNPVQLFGLSWANWKGGILFSAGSLLAVFPIVLFVTALSKLALGNSDTTQDLIVYLQNSRHFLERALLIFTAVIVAPVAEETIFRGYLHGVIRKYAGRWCGIVVNSLLFAAIHGHAPSLGGLFVLAVALSLVYERTGSLWAPMLMHATFNTVTVVAALVWPEMFQ